ncbi:uncharacterized protein F54H12.2-like isoform X2 [Paramacrobiotus metropolitanus]|uniref:uncharacterized protein F54H12.2-like isoform X2 n=1 Tax=Paramacrobiotus metropolitanus TaxID=2943436 RepID=UPI002445F7E6|nr:uncharacterized protein F54H12.2-like isoform X2 [Paramacrobiotus metropolitanus]XP_055347326.1 uncharacterized protein F54H12.2-like isoform X2 [Paramacrobiotus metropolitanus]
MAFILEGSMPAMQVESDLFSVPATLADFVRTEEERILPTSGQTEEISSGEISFYIPPSTSALLVLPEITLEMDIAIKKQIAGLGAATHIENTDLVAPVNLIAHSIFSSVEVTMANRLITNSSPLYAHRAYLENLLGYAPAALKSQATSAGFYIDTPGYLEDHANNAEEVTRKAMFVTNEYVPFSAKLCTDIFQQGKDLITGVPLHVRLILNKPEFYLRSYANLPVDAFKAYIRNPRLYVKRFVPNPAYLSALTAQLSTKTVKYPIERVCMRVNDIGMIQSTVLANLHIGAVPKCVFVGFVKSSSFHGLRRGNPFNFEHFNLNYISVEVDGQSYPAQAYRPNFATGDYLQSYDCLLETLGRLHAPDGALPFDRKAFAEGFAIWGFDLTPSRTGRGPMSTVRQGNLSIRLQFAAQLTEPIMAITMMVWDNIIEVNSHRQLIADFTA